MSDGGERIFIVPKIQIRQYIRYEYGERNDDRNGGKEEARSEEGIRVVARPKQGNE